MMTILGLGLAWELIKAMRERRRHLNNIPDKIWAAIPVGK
jgi:hypothetical protein